MEDTHGYENPRMGPHWVELDRQGRNSALEISTFKIFIGFSILNVSEIFTGMLLISSA